MTLEVQSYHGDGVELTPLTHQDAASIAPHFQSPAAFAQLDFSAPGPSVEELALQMKDARNQLFLWKMQRPAGELMGYAGLVGRIGPPRVFFFCLNDPWDYDVCMEATRLLVPFFFDCVDGRESLLCLFVPQERGAELTEPLSEMGFDPYDGYNDDSAAGSAAFAIDRITFAAYFADEGQDDTWA